MQRPLFDQSTGSSKTGSSKESPAAARRCANLNGQPVSWELRRARRKTIGFAIDQHGLRVSAPPWVTLADIDRALGEKANWIVRKLAERREYAARRERFMPCWENGAPIPVLGATFTLRIDPEARGVTATDRELRIGVPSQASPEQVAKLGHAWLQQTARRAFAERIPVFAERLGRAPTRWALSSARTRWGSCARDGSIRLNWRLVHFPRDIMDYVIAHELAHLREMNHGPRFWAIVAELFPEFERARAWLRQFPDDIAPA
jgi:predicted metal-dependent hydrolase